MRLTPETVIREEAIRCFNRDLLLFLILINLRSINMYGLHMIRAEIAIGTNSFNNVPDLYMEGSRDPIIMRETAIPSQSIYFEIFEYNTLYSTTRFFSKV